MNKYTFIIAGLLVLSPVIASASFDTSLKYGARGQAVVELQDLLTNENCLNASSSGYFGLLTLKAVKCFQAKYNLPSTGFFGMMSRAKANEVVADITGPSNAAALIEASTTTSVATNKPNITKPKNFTLPNGTVIDEQGNIISTVTTNTNTVTPVPQTVNTNNTSSLSVAIGQITTTTTSAHLSWSTSMPTDSKVFFTPPSGTTQVIPSASGYSTQHFVDISSLTANTQYSYTIEAINGAQDQKLTGIISTNAIPVVVCSQPTITTNLSTTSLSVYPFKSPYPNYDYDVPVKADVQIYSNCGFDPATLITLDANIDRAKAYNPSQLTGSSSGAFGKVEEINKYHNFNSKISTDGTTISFTASVNVRTFDAGTQYISVGLGGKQVQVTEVNIR